MSLSIDSEPNQLENPGLCTHAWTEPRFVMFTSGVEGAIRDCSKCGGYMHPCTNCDDYHLVCKGRGGKRGMPAELCKWDMPYYATCIYEEYMELPVPVVRIPPYQEPPVTYAIAMYEDVPSPSFHRRRYPFPPNLGIGLYSTLEVLQHWESRLRFYRPPSTETVPSDEYFGEASVPRWGIPLGLDDSITEFAPYGEPPNRPGDPHLMPDDRPHTLLEQNDTEKG